MMATFLFVAATIVGNTRAMQTTMDLPTTEATDYFNAEIYEVADAHNFHPEDGSANTLPIPEIGGTYWWAQHNLDGWEAVGVAFTNAYQDPITNEITSESALSKLVYKCWSHESSQGRYHQAMFQVRGTDDPNVNVHIAYMIDLFDPTRWRRIGIKPSKPAGATASDDQTSFVVENKRFPANSGDLFTASHREEIAGCYGSAYIYNQRVKNGPNKIKVQIPNRAVAFGRFDPDTNKGKVDFTDDQEYKMQFNPSTGIIDWDGLERPWSGDKRREWDGTNHWQKDTPDIAGQFNHVTDANKNCDIVINRLTDNKIEVDWAGCNSRPKAKGFVNCPTGAGQPYTGKVNFPDDKSYRLAFYPSEGRIYWDGKPGNTNNIWVLDQSIYDKDLGVTYTEGYYFDPFDLWEVDEIMDEIQQEMDEEMDDNAMFNVDGIQVGQANEMMMNWGLYILLSIVLVIGLYFGYNKWTSTKKQTYEPLLPN